MTASNSNTVSSFGTGYFFLGLVGVYLLVLGLLKQDNLLRIAVFGPLLTGAFGLFLLMLTVDWRHGLSSTLQSATSTFFHRLSLKESSRLLSVIILFLSLNLVWLSAFLLPRNAPSMFGFALLSAAGLAPLLIGKFVSSSTKLLPSTFGDEERSEEFERISNALRTMTAQPQRPSKIAAPQTEGSISCTSTTDLRRRRNVVEGFGTIRIGSETKRGCGEVELWIILRPKPCRISRIFFEHQANTTTLTGTWWRPISLQIPCLSSC